jgi:hypothetical protein
MNLPQPGRVRFLGDAWEGTSMPSTTRMPEQFPENTKYVLEARGPVVRRYLEFPDGRKMELEPRRVSTCRCHAQHALKEAARKRSAQAA